MSHLNETMQSAGAMRVLIVTGLPATGKSTLARFLAQRWSTALIAKDRIKEPLLDVLGAADPAASRALSDASFAVLFALARELLCARTSVVLEGNFRTGEHDAPLRDLLSTARVDCAQILCRTDEPERLRRLAERALDPARHPGHRDAELASTARAHGDGYLSLPGDRFTCAGTGAPEWPLLLERLDRWWKQ